MAQAKPKTFPRDREDGQRGGFWMRRRCILAAKTVQDAAGRILGVNTARFGYQDGPRGCREAVKTPKPTDAFLPYGGAFQGRVGGGVNPSL